MNPHQGHVLELKLAAALALPYEDYWKVHLSLCAYRICSPFRSKMFGEGKHEDFSNLLDTKLSAHLSSHAASHFHRLSCAVLRFQFSINTGVPIQPLSTTLSTA